MTSLLSAHGRATRRPRAVGPFAIARAGGSKDREDRPIGAFVLGIGAVLALALLAVLSMGSPARAAFPGQNGKLVCAGALQRGPGVQDTDTEIYTMNPDGSAQTYLTNNGPLLDPADPNSTVDDFDPVFSPDSRKIAFESYRTGQSEIFTMNADGSSPQRLTTAPGEDRPGSYSPDGRQIVFHSTRDGNNDFEVYKMNADGTNQTRLTSHAGQDSNPSWSPDGTRIAFHAVRQPGEPGNSDPAGTPANLEIYTIDTSGGDIRRLTNFSAIDAFPQWSPDGRKLVFRRHIPATPPATGTNSEIFTMNADGTNLVNLTNNAVDNPATTTVNESFDDQGIWSPDGTRIVFDSNRSGDREVYTMNASNGGDVRRVTSALGFDGRCDWGRVPPPPPARPATPIYPRPPIIPSAGKLNTKLTLKARPRRDRRLPFRYTFSGSVRLPAGANKAKVCGGRVRLRLTKGRRTVARGVARVSKGCTYKKRITIRSTRRTGTKRGRMKVGATFGGNAFLKGSKTRTTVRFF